MDFYFVTYDLEPSQYKMAAPANSWDSSSTHTVNNKQQTAVGCFSPKSSTSCPNLAINTQFEYSHDNNKLAQSKTFRILLLLLNCWIHRVRCLIGCNFPHLILSVSSPFSESDHTKALWGHLVVKMSTTAVADWVKKTFLF